MPHHHQRAEGNAGVHVAGEVDVAHRPGIRAPPARLDFIDDLHGPHLRGSRDGPRGQSGAKRVEGCLSRPQSATHIRRDVHHVAVPLDFHQVGKVHRAVFGHSPDIVAGQVDQHHMLGPLLGVGEQLLFEPLVFFLGRAAAAGPRERPHRDLPFLDPHHDLGRSPHQLNAGGLEQEHERAGVDDPQRPIDVDGPRRSFQLQPLANHHLKNVPGADVVLAVPDRRLEPVAGETRAPFERRLAPQVDVGQLEIGGSLLQLPAHGVDLVAGGLVGGLRVGLIEPGVSHHQHGFLDLVENDHPVVEGKRQVGEMPVVGRGVGKPLDVADHVVAEVSDGSPAEPGEAGDMRGAILRDALFQIAEGVGRLVNFGLTAAGDFDPRAEGIDLEEGVGPEKAVAANLLATYHAFEQETGLAPLQLAVSRERGQRIAHQLAVDGDEVGRGGQLPEGIEVGKEPGHGGDGVGAAGW